MNGTAHVELRLRLTGGLLLILGLGGVGGDDQFGYGGLEFHIVGTGLLCGQHHAPGQFVIAVVVDAGLGYYNNVWVVIHFFSG